MAENYDLIFGQSASQQYAWSDSDYQNGWQTVGSTPPTAEQFDALQRRSDTKAQDLNNRLEPIESKSEADGRQAATSYTAGAMVTVDGLPNGWLLQCIVPGISGTDAITLPDILIDGLTIIDGDVTWALRKVATNGGLGFRQPSTAYTAGQIAYHASLPTGYYLECTTAGTTDSGDLTIISPSIGGTVSDGTVVWTVRTPFGVKPYQSVADLDDALDSRVLFATPSTANSPISSGYFSVAVLGNNTTGYGNVMQIAIAGNNNIYTRTQANSGWSAWQKQESIVAKSLNNGNGYIKYASGLIIQWNVINGASNNGIYTINFPISFTNVHSINVIPWLQDDKGVKAIIRNYTKNLTQAQFVIFDSNFNILTSFSTSGAVGALAIGY